MNSRTTRSGSQGSATVSDMNELLTAFEQRIMLRFDEICTKISYIETRLEKVQSEQIRVSLEIGNMKDIIVQQQRTIERIESEKRELHLILTGIPENEVEVNAESLTTDAEKINFLCDEVVEDYDDSALIECVRLGRYDRNRSRPVKIKLNQLRIRNILLRSQKDFRQSENIKNSFGTIFVNPDRTPLARKEDKRLRDKLKELRSSAPSTDKIYIKSGQLFHNSMMVDKFNIGNQLF